MIGEFVITRSHDQGVVTGFLRSISGRACELDEARQVHYWEGANTLFEMSLRGCESARISEPSAYTFLHLDVCGVIRCTPEATENLRQSRWNKPYTPAKPTRPGKTRG